MRKSKGKFLLKNVLKYAKQSISDKSKTACPCFIAVYQTLYGHEEFNEWKTDYVNKNTVLSLFSKFIIKVHLDTTVATSYLATVIY